MRISDWSSDVCSSDLIVATGHVHDPAVILRRGRSYIFDLRNETAWWHPIHLHGHVFRVIARNGAPTPSRAWQDTVLCAPHDRVATALDRMRVVTGKSVSERVDIGGTCLIKNKQLPNKKN